MVPKLNGQSLAQKSSISAKHSPGALQPSRGAKTTTPQRRWATRIFLLELYDIRNVNAGALSRPNREVASGSVNIWVAVRRRKSIRRETQQAPRKCARAAICQLPYARVRINDIFRAIVSPKWASRMSYRFSSLFRDSPAAPGVGVRLTVNDVVFVFSAELCAD